MQNTNLDTAFTKIISILEKEKFQYLIIGGLATSILGEARVTNDIDILISLHEKDLQCFLKIARKKGFQFNTQTIQNSINLRGVFQLAYDKVHIDFLIGQMPFELEAFQRRKRIKLFDLTASFPTEEDLILLKLIAGREKDILDIKNIIIRHGKKLDTTYLKKWAKIIARDLRNPSINKQLVELLENNK